MYRFYIDTESDSDNPKSMFETWEYFQAYIEKHATGILKFIERKVNFSFLKDGDALRAELKESLRFDLSISCLTYLLRIEKESKYRLIRGFCGEKGDVFEKRKADLYRKYDDLVLRFPFFETQHKIDFSCPIEKDFLNYCLANYGKLPKELKNRTKLGNGSIVYKKGYGLLEYLFEEQKNKKEFIINSANRLKVSCPSAVAYHIEQHFMFCAYISYFTDNNYSHLNRFISINSSPQSTSDNNEQTEGHGISDGLFEEIAALSAPLTRLSFIKIYAAYRRSAEIAPKLAYSNLRESYRSAHRLSGQYVERYVIDTSVYGFHVVMSELLHDIQAYFKHRAKDMLRFNMDCGEENPAKQIESLCKEANDRILECYRHVFAIAPRKKGEPSTDPYQQMQGIKKLISMHYLKDIGGILKMGSISEDFIDEELALAK